MRKRIVVLGIIFILLISCAIVCAYTIPSLKIIKPTLWNTLFNKPKGTWQCNGNCTYNGVDVSDTYNCVPDPMQEIPEGGFTDITGDKPKCVCLKANPGTCAWYDSGYGQQATDNLQCGGSCPPGSSCNSWVTGTGKEKCECVKEEQEACKYHPEPSSLTQGMNPDMCYGYCSEGEDCVVYENDRGEEMCGCLKSEQNDRCGFHSTVQSPDMCYGWCEDTTEVCQYISGSNSGTNDCRCVNLDDGDQQPSTDCNSACIATGKYEQGYDEQYMQGGQCSQGYVHEVAMGCCCQPNCQAELYVSGSRYTMNTRFPFTVSTFTLISGGTIVKSQIILPSGGSSTGFHLNPGRVYCLDNSLKQVEDQTIKVPVTGYDSTGKTITSATYTITPNYSP